MVDLIDKKLLLDSLELLIIPEDNNDFDFPDSRYVEKYQIYALKKFEDANYNNGIKDAIKFIKGMKKL